MNIDKQRLRALVRGGKLSAGEAAQMGQALDRMNRWRGERDESPRPRKGASPVAELKLRFLAGEISEAKFLAEARSAAPGDALRPGHAAVLCPDRGHCRRSRFGARGGRWRLLCAPARTRPLAALPAPADRWRERSPGADVRLAHAPLRARSSRPAPRLTAGRGRPPRGAPGGDAPRPVPHLWRAEQAVQQALEPGAAALGPQPGARHQRAAPRPARPREMHSCKECGTAFIDCLGCKTSVDALDWSTRSQFGQWSGMHCARCGASIPCLRNALALDLEAPVHLAVWLYQKLRGHASARA